MIHQQQAKNIVIFISAHGAADRVGGYLLPDDTTGAVGERLRLTALIDHLAQLPPSAHKLLVLDTTQIAGDWRLGILHN